MASQLKLNWLDKRFSPSTPFPAKSTSGRHTVQQPMSTTRCLPSSQKRSKSCFCCSASQQIPPTMVALLVTKSEQNTLSQVGAPLDTKPLFCECSATATAAVASVGRQASFHELENLIIFFFCKLSTLHRAPYLLLLPVNPISKCVCMFTASSVTRWHLNKLIFSRKLHKRQAQHQRCSFGLRRLWWARWTNSNSHSDCVCRPRLLFCYSWCRAALHHATLQNYSWKINGWCWNLMYATYTAWLC